MSKQTGVQKILVGGAAGALIGGAATYAATHQKQTEKMLKQVVNATEKAAKKIDTKKLKELSTIAMDKVMHSQNATAQKAVKRAEKALPKVTKAKKKVTAQRKAVK